MNQLVISLTLCLLQPPPGPVEGFEPVACYELATYDSKTECELNARTLRVEVKSRLMCRPREISPDERRALKVLRLVRQ